jgi:hypothetical protein
MAALTVYLKTSGGFAVNVLLTDSTGAKFRLTNPQFNQPGTGAHAQERLATVNNFSPSPAFQARLIIATDGPGKALVDFAVDQNDLPAQDALYADFDNSDTGYKVITFP